MADETPGKEQRASPSPVRFALCREVSSNTPVIHFLNRSLKRTLFDMRFALFGLVRCPLCRRRPAGEQGCCAACLAEVFAPYAEPSRVFLGGYRGGLERLVHAYKFGSATSLSRAFAPALAEAVRAQGWALDLICPVPLHPHRERERGYNQSALLAEALALELGLPYRSPLTRTRPTRQQAKLAQEARFANVSGAFACAPLRGERVLLVDDVLTSGATTAACKAALRTAGARQVRIAAIAGPGAD